MGVWTFGAFCVAFGLFPEDVISLRFGLVCQTGSVALAGDLEGRQGCRARPKAADSRQWGSRTQRRTRSRSSGGQPAGVASAVLQWGQAYRDFHAAAWVEASRVFRPGGRFLLNIKDAWPT